MGGEYITRSAGRGADFVRLRGLAFPTSNWVDRPSRKTYCGRESEIDRLGGFPVLSSVPVL